MSDNTILWIRGVMRDVFDDDTIEITKTTTAADIEGWDSMNHVRLIVAIEQDLGIELPIEMVNELQNVGDLAALIEDHKK